MAGYGFACLIAFNIKQKHLLQALNCLPLVTSTIVCLGQILLALDLLAFIKMFWQVFGKEGQDNSTGSDSSVENNSLAPLY
jgi:hypothetical protein